MIDGWILDLDVARSWERNPMIYAAAIADGVHNLMTMESAAPQVRMLRVRDKLRGVPALLDAARANLKNPPRVLAERGLGMFQGASAMLSHDLALALDAPRGESWDAMMAEANSAQKAIDAFVAEYPRTILARANGKIALGRDYVEARYRAEELIDLPAPRMLEIAQRELALEQALFLEKAHAVDSTRDAMDVWRDVLRDHPKRGELVEATRRVVDELQQFVTSQGLVRLPSDDRVIVEPSKPFDIGLASMHASPPMEPAPVKSIFYVTDAQADWSLERQDKWLERFNYPSLTITSAHEAMPGHFVHSLFMRSTPGKIRRIWIGLNPFPAAVERTGRLGALRRAPGDRTGLQAGGSALRDGAAVGVDDAHLPPDRQPQRAHQRLEHRAGGEVLRGERARSRPGRHAGSDAGGVRPDQRRLLPRQAGTADAARGRDDAPRVLVQPARLPRAGHAERDRALVGASPVAAAGGYGSGDPVARAAQAPAPSSVAI